MSRQRILIVAAVLGISGLNFAAGFYTAKHILKDQYEELSKEEIADAKLYYSRLHKKGEFSDPVELANRAAEVSDLIAAETITKVLRYVPGVENNVTVVEEDEVDLTTSQMITDAELVREIEIAAEHGHPYLISKEEYLTNATEYEQITLTYFEEDDLLVDENDLPIEYIPDTIGIETTNRFGIMSGDHNIVYIRSDRKCVEYEIVRNKGNYAKEVLGFVEHSDTPRVRKFRRDYE